LTVFLNINLGNYFNSDKINYYENSCCGATGMVGRTMIKVLEERNFPVTELIPAASERSVGKELTFKGKSVKVVSVMEAIEARPVFAIFSAGASVSKEWAPAFAENGDSCY